jgi:hypothetical protein
MFPDVRQMTRRYAPAVDAARDSSAIQGWRESALRAPLRHPIRVGVAGLCVLAIGLLAWQLAIDAQPGRIFGVYTPRRFLALAGATYALLWGAYCALASGSAIRKTANGALAAAGFVGFWGLVELPALLGIVDYRSFLSLGRDALLTRIKPWEDPHNLFDRELMYRRRPGERIVGNTTGDLVYWLGIAAPRRYQVDARYDRHGFRNDRALDAAPVALIGDSFLEAGLVPYAEILSTRLSQLLGVDVANLGLGGYGPQQELGVLRRYALPLQPRIAVWFFFEGNDLLDVRRYQEYARNADEYLADLYGFANRSFTTQALQALINATSGSPAGDSSEAHRRSCRLRGGDSGAAETIYFCYGAAPLSDTELASLAIAETQMLEAQRLTAASGATFMLVYVPTKFRVYQGLCDFPAGGYAETWKLNDLPDRLAQWSAAHDVPFLDLTAALREHAARGELVYFADDGHWNAHGHAVAASAVAQAIATHGWLTAPQ